jgi:oligopeptide/dipeptide ABC transporter ATP-binding protein
MIGHHVADNLSQRREGEGSPILQVRGLSLFLPGAGGTENQILNDVSFDLGRGQTIGLIGESGSGKSMTALSILRLLPDNARTEGQILFDGVDLLRLSAAELSKIRGNRISMVFQDPMTALDPVFTIGHQIVQVLRTHRDCTKRAAREQAIAMLDAVGMPDPKRRFGEYPYQLSGGMQQRAMIAMALVCESELLIADEPTTAVDITIQAQLLELLRRINRDFGLAVVFITHDIGVVAEFCQNVMVMYSGQVVEASGVDDLLDQPLHPYTSALLRAVPSVTARAGRLHAIPGRVPLTSQVLPGCRFLDRCEYARHECGVRAQDLAELDPVRSRTVRCERASVLQLPGTQALNVSDAPGERL